MQRIRILEIVGNADGGGTKCVSRIVQHLDPERFEILVISPASPWLAEVCARHRARYLPLPISNSRLNLKQYRELAEIVARERPDIVSAHGTRAAWYVLRALGGIGQKPKLMYSEHLFSFDARRSVARFPWMLIERSICQHANAMAFACRENARLAESRGWIASERIAMRHYGIELDDFTGQARDRLTRTALGIPNDAPLIGTVGRLIPQKGMRYLLDAASRVIAQQPSAMLLIVGDGELREELESHSHRLGIHEHVRFVGAVRHPWRILANCDVIAFSSLFEGLPQTCIEALAIGMPVVATRMKGTSELIRSGQNGLLVPTRDARSLAGGILELLNDPELRRRFSEAGPSAVSEYRTEWMVARYRDVYERLATAPRANWHAATSTPV